MINRPTLIINEVSRRTVDGNTEVLRLSRGLNVIVGEPNTGKTKWLETIDYLLGETGFDPYSVGEEDKLQDKYEAAALHFTIGGETHYVERRWRERGNKNKFFLDEEALNGKEFQHFLMNKLNIPIISSPSGNPYSGRTWPELSFRTLLRHFYRQQGLWGGLVDKQPEDTFRASVQQFLGLAEFLYTDDFEEIVQLRLDIQRLEARRDQYKDTLEEIAQNFLEEEDLSLAVTEGTLSSARQRLDKQYNDAVQERATVINDAIKTGLAVEAQSSVLTLTSKRAEYIARLDESEQKFASARERLSELTAYRKTLLEEQGRLSRADTAKSVLSGLRITHCPSCNQSIDRDPYDEHQCVLCQQDAASSDFPDEMAGRRIEFEKTRLQAELSEADNLISEAERIYAENANEISRLKAGISDANRELEPARNQVSALIQESVSAIDIKLGSIGERLKQVRRLLQIFSNQKAIEVNISALKRELEPILKRNQELASGLDYSGRAALLENGMNDYLASLNKLRPNTWRHSAVEIYLSKSTAAFRVGSRRWDVSLGGTASLYYLMAYHYGLLSLIKYEGSRYPGFLMVDFPAEFAGVKIGDADDFVVQPFIDLLAQNEFEECQVIFTGAAFSSLKNVNRVLLSEPYIS